MVHVLFGGAQLTDIILLIPALLIAVTAHEYAHARMAYHFGDDTAERMGRMTLNPISHLDPIGTLMILLFRFGWAKPVPINPYRFRNYRSGLLWVSLAGPLANFTLAFISLFLYHLLARLGLAGFTAVNQFIALLLQLNIFLGIFNLIPIPPLDGSKILMALAPDSLHGFFRQIEAYAPIILVVLLITGVFRNLILVPASNAILTLFHNIVSFIFRFI